MKEAKDSDRQRIIEILTYAFESNTSVNYIVKQDERRIIRIGHLMEYALKVCFAYGKVLVSEDGNGCALVLLPEKKGFSLRSLIWDVGLVFRVIGLCNVLKVMGRESRIRAQHPAGLFYYLWFIGVHPLHKDLGIGSTLLNEIIADAAAMGRPVYLETSTLKNLPWYKRFGFQVYHELDFGYPLFLLKYNG